MASPVFSTTAGSIGDCAESGLGLEEPIEEAKPNSKLETQKSAQI
tara:strand:+ start:477 stop:611 length:135 start_codon:yes stop_codon:yes gene_type:complete